MGQFEKIVVLIAFFLVTVILVVTFSTPEEGGLSLNMGASGTASEQVAEGQALRDSSTKASLGAENPELTERLTNGDAFAQDVNGLGSNPRKGVEGLRGTSGLGGAGTPGPGAIQNGSTPQATDSAESLGGLSLEALSRAEREGTSKPSEGDLFLDDSFSTRARARGKLPTTAALITLEGLTPTFDKSIMEYKWKRNDTWVDLAQRFYGDSKKSSLLRQFNEGSNYRAPGEAILVPVFDGREGQADTSKAESVADNSSDSSRKDATPASVERGNLYRVVDGDSLWVISKKVYGKGSEWEKIYTANKDVLASPDDVKPGMGLRIP